MSDTLVTALDEAEHETAGGLRRSSMVHAYVNDFLTSPSVDPNRNRNGNALDFLTGAETRTSPSVSALREGADRLAEFEQVSRHRDGEPIARFNRVQEWEGYVHSLSSETFVGRVLDVTNSENQEELEAEFLLSDLTRSQRERLRVGLVFRWAIGYAITKGGQRRRSSQIVFRRLPTLTKRDISDAESFASMWAERLKYGENADRGS